MLRRQVLNIEDLRRRAPSPATAGNFGEPDPVQKYWTVRAVTPELTS